MQRSAYTPDVPMVKGLGLWFPPASEALRHGRSTSTLFPFACYRAPHPRPPKQFRTPWSPSAVGLKGTCSDPLRLYALRNSPQAKSFWEKCSDLCSRRVYFLGPGPPCSFCRLLEAVELSSRVASLVPSLDCWLLPLHITTDGWIQQRVFLHNLD